MDDVIKFVMNGDLVVAHTPDPTRTVLQYLREDQQLAGTKEGCAEGDCGACTVVVAELDETTQVVTHKAINACIAFLPTLHGKALFTVEGLSSAQQPHPVQQAMVDHHAAQCGFCTPGFVMSLFAQFQNGTHLDPVGVDEVLSGNLCRCTGYRPIKSAALSMYDYPLTDSQTNRTPHEHLQNLQQELKNAPALSLKTAQKRFRAPKTVEELGQVLLETPDAHLLAGGTDIGLWVTKGHQKLTDIIYTGSVASLHDIRLNDAELVIGAAATWSEAMPAIIDLYPDLRDLLVRFASVPIRNVATIGGNIANGSPIGDSMPALMVIDAQLVLRKGDVTRQVPLEDFFLAYQQTALAAGEFIQSIIVPRPRAGQFVAAYKISKRFDQDISAVCGCFSLTLDDVQHNPQHIRIAFGGMAAIPQRATAVEQALAGHPWTKESIEAAITRFLEDFSPISDVRASADYRMSVAQNLLRRFFIHTTQPDQLIDVYRYGR